MLPFARWTWPVVLAAVMTLTLAAATEAGSHTSGPTVPAIVSRALPAVVSIITRQIEQDQFNQPVPTRGLGSGFIVDPRGYILTNNHVVEGAEDIKVTFHDLLQQHRIGESVDVTVWRNGETLTLRPVPEEYR